MNEYAKFSLATDDSIDADGLFNDDKISLRSILKTSTDNFYRICKAAVFYAGI
ncbi:MAG: hypothetical protein HND50_16600 [Calditrichaeota bacterium]|nr:hypothetical protein [Calditrichota bacterium]